MRNVAAPALAIWAGATATVVIWMTMTDPVRIATLIAAGDVWTLLTTFAEYVLSVVS